MCCEHAAAAWAAFRAIFSLPPSVTVCLEAQVVLPVTMNAKMTVVERKFVQHGSGLYPVVVSCRLGVAVDACGPSGVH